MSGRADDERNRLRDFGVGFGVTLCGLAALGTLFAVVGLGFWIGERSAALGGVYGVVAFAAFIGLIFAFGEDDCGY